jgi:hypothetical protein
VDRRLALFAPSVEEPELLEEQHEGQRRANREIEG